MDDFQYKVYSDKWNGLTTNKQREEFIRNIYYTMGNYLWAPATPVYDKDINKVRLLRNCFHTFDIDILPIYIPATIQTLRIPNE